MSHQDSSHLPLLEELAKMRRRIALLEGTLVQQPDAVSEAQLLEAHEVANLGFYVFDIATGRWTSSRVLDQILGIPAGFERTVAGWESLVHPEERQGMLDYLFQEVIGRKQPFNREYRIVRYGDRQVRWLHGLGRLQFDQEGQPAFLLGTIQDVTERKQAEHALRESEERFRQAMDATNDGLWDWNVATGDVYYSPSYYRMMGYEPGEFAERVESWIERLHPDDRATALAANEACIENRIPSFEVEFRMREKGGRWKTILGRGKAIRRDARGRALRMIGTHVDITERKRMEEALQGAHRELEQRVEERTAELAKANENLDNFRRFAESSGEGFGMAELDGRLIYANPTLLRLFGEETMEDVLGKSVLDYYPAEWPKRRLEEVLPSVEKTGHWAGEQVILSKQGRLIPAWHDVFLLRDELGNAVRRCAVVTDISERKRAQEALAKEHRYLKQMLRSSDHERQLIAYEIHDGLAQQLAGAIMQLQAFQHLREANPQDAEVAFQAAMAMLQQGHFEVRRLIAGVRPPILDESGVIEAIAHLVHEFQLRKEPQIDFVSSVQFTRLVPVMENAIYRICQEALTNARQHSKSQKVRVVLSQKNDQVRILVQDWGIGFNPKAVLKSRFGLEGIQQRARLLGGTCSIRSAPGEGTRIAVKLPVLLRDEEEGQ
jgi:PAS domain S-box-containing protein